MRIAVPVALSPAALTGHDPHARVWTLTGEAMGTVWQVRLAAVSERDLPALRAAITARLEGIVAEMSHWEAGSLLSRFNRLPAGAWLPLPPDFAHVIAAALDVSAASNGTFDPTLGALANLHGLGPAGAIGDVVAADVARANAEAGWRRLAFDPASRRLRQPGGLRLDLSGIAKGFAVDAVADLLASRGIAHCLVEIGGELVGRGLRPDGEPWWVDLESPAGAPFRGFRLALHQLAVATSGDTVRGAHMIDPRTGWPARNSVALVSVVDPSAMIADAWASALMVLGLDAGLACATRERLAVRMVARQDGGWIEGISPALAAMLD